MKSRQAGAESRCEIIVLMRLTPSHNNKLADIFYELMRLVHLK